MAGFCRSYPEGDMNYWHFLAGVGALLNDFLAVISVIGTTVMLFSPSRASSFADMSVVPLALGVVCQVALRLTGTMPLSIGFFKFSPQLVDALFAVALASLALKIFLSLLRTRRSEF
jgi:hypothetical protein